MTEKIKFCYYNLVDQASTIITGGNPDAQFPASNIKSTLGTKVYRSTTSSDSVVFDFITTEPVDSIILVGHSLDGFGFSGSITIEANATNVWSSPAFTTTLTPDYSFNFTLKALASAENYRYWRISGSGSSYFELGKVFIGQAFQPQRNIGNSFTFENRDNASYSSSRYEQRYFDETIDQKFLRGNINLIEKANVDEMLNFIDYVGRRKPFFVIPDESEVVTNDYERFSGRYYFRERPDAKHVIRGVYNFTLTMEGAT